MIQQHATLLRRLMIFIDLVVASAAFYLGYMLRSQLDGLYSLSNYFWIFPVFIISWAFFLYVYGMYSSFRFKPMRQIIEIIVKAGATSFIVFTAFNYLFQLSYISRLFILFIYAISLILFLIEKCCLMYFFRQVRRKGYNYRRVLIVGSGRRAQKFINKVHDTKEFGLNIVGLIDDEPELVGTTVCDCKILGVLNDIPQVLKTTPIDQVVFIVPHSWIPRLTDSVLHCETVGVSVSVAVDYFDLRFATARPDSLHGFPLLTFETTPIHAFDLFVKRGMDIIFSFSALTILFPLFMIVAALIKITSRGPMFFRQERKGLNGRIFYLYKFRTMVIDAEDQLAKLKQYNEMAGPAFKMANDPRVTALGKWLRKTSIDELPQLWNVLIGNMSLVGPRPPIVKEVEQYDYWHRRRLSMRPGITCLWQIKGRNRITDFNEWTKLDLEYIDNWSLWLDLKILLQTIPAVLFGVGAK